MRRSPQSPRARPVRLAGATDRSVVRIRTQFAREYGIWRSMECESVSGRFAEAGRIWPLSPRFGGVGDLRRLSLEALLRQAVPPSTREIAAALPLRARPSYWRLLVEEELAGDLRGGPPARLRALERLLALDDSRGAPAR